MTAYHGGKQRLGKQLAEIIVDTSLDIAEEEEFDIVGYCEPFCGMLGVYRHIPELFEEEGYDDLTYLAGDTNGSVIKMWQAAQKGWKPPTTCSEKKYNDLRTAPDSALKGFIGHQCSFGGQYFNGYSKKYDSSKSPKKASERVIDISSKLIDVKFYNDDYHHFSNLKNFVIYCDPPYDNTISRYDKAFESSKFFEWCKKMSKHNIVYISEYKAPMGFKCIYKSKKVNKSCDGYTKCSNYEKLFLI
jgi:DNA adenine methylase